MYADCSVLLRVAFDLGLPFSISNITYTQYAIGRFRKVGRMHHPSMKYPCRWKLQLKTTIAGDSGCSYKAASPRLSPRHRVSKLGCLAINVSCMTAVVTNSHNSILYGKYVRYDC